MTAAASAHSLSDDQFDRLGAGFGDAAAVSWLAGAQSSIQRELLAAVGRFGPQGDKRFTDAWDLLVSLDAAVPDAVGVVLAHPYTRVWAVGLLDGISRGELVGEDVYHLEAVAAAAAVRAGRDVRVPVPVRGGVAPLPTFGALVAGSGDRVWIDAGSVAGLDLARPLRCLTAEGITVVLEDTDPYRAVPYRGSEICPVDQLDAAEAESWQRAFTAAIDIVDTFLPGYAPGLRAGLRTVLPLQTDHKFSRSASTRLAFGAVGLAPAQLDGASLAELLVHEFQHVKMGAILDVFELYDLSDTEPRYHPLCFVHPRPIEGLLQSTYAHIGVSDYWRVRRTLVDGAERVEAERQFARWRMMTAEAIGQLRDSGSLTGLGERFVQAMGETVMPWLSEPVDPAAEAAAREAAEEHRDREAGLRAVGQRNP